MDSSAAEIAYEFPPFYVLYKDGHVKRLIGTDFVQASLDPQTGVSSKDVIIVPETGVSARLYLPKITDPHQKLPLLIYFHGGGFVIETAFSPTYHYYLNSLVAQANIVAVSVEYRRAPEYPLPIAYDDSWAVLQWVVSHSMDQDGAEPWLRDHVDCKRIFLAGDSAGANIAHDMAMRAGATGLKLRGIALIHPYFWGEKRIGSEAEDPDKAKMADKMWLLACPSSAGADDPRINPVGEGAPSLSRLGCSRLLVCVGEKDILKDRGLIYYETLVKSGWSGEAEIMESQGEDHVFHLFNPTCEKAVTLMKRLVSFVNIDD
ncbi:PREDICTED: probable carboxylesterase 2 [Nelumbo nucifera]|uniref:Alpha/beta hydrolase fold-3 domain-containing protein n=2 Tax=Nelumbo nucifera TaxID=4432 RepID=A0A822ZC09_NELNU|nr:PREDICTED: probable carboxylesterase 2 [Nelumbo nucifera]DAD41221.1 TPA_asm: hypothetical protein HUJ06_015544 [Nelumbo nucifera]